MSRIDAAYEKTEPLWWDMSGRGIVALIAALTLVRIFVAGRAGLLWDEPYYWLWAQHLAAGYYDHPPMVALWIRAGTALFGDGTLGLRALFIANLAVTPLAIYATGRALFDKRTAERGALWAAVTPLLSIAGMLATPDGPATLFWTLAVLAFALVVKTGRGSWWLAVGVFAGLGLISKYTDFFLGAGILLALALDGRLRRWLISPWLYASGAIAFLIFLPVLQWNIAHQWVSFRFQFGRVAEHAFNPVDLVTLVATQPLIFNPLAAIFLAVATRLWIKRSEPYGRNLGLLIATAIPAVAFILFQATHGAVLQHWLAPVFPTLALAAAAAAGQLPEGAKYLRRARTDVVPFALAAALAVWAYIATPADRYFPGKDPLDSMRGWPEFAERVLELQTASGATWIATTDYPSTGTLAYFLRGRATVVPVSERERYTFMPPPDPALLGEPALLLAKASPEALAGCFARLTPVGEAARYGSGRLADGPYPAYRAENAAADLFVRGCDRAPE